MLTQKDISLLCGIFARYGYVMTTGQLSEEKLYYRDIQKMLEQDLIEKVKWGCYHWINDDGTSEIVMINRLFHDAVLCMDTALFYYKYSDRIPAEWHITTDKNTSRQRTQIDYPFIKAYRVEPELLTLGETKGTIDFIEVRIYDRDRTICDVLRNMNKMDREIFNKAIQGYVKDPQKTYRRSPMIWARLRFFFLLWAGTDTESSFSWRDSISASLIRHICSPPFIAVSDMVFFSLFGSNTAFLSISTC